MHAATGHAADDFRIFHGDFQHVVDFHAGVTQGFGLRDGAREAVEQEAVGAVVSDDALLDQANDDFVGNQATAGHHFLDLQTQRALGLDRGTQHVAGGDLRNAELFGDEASLSTFAGTRCPQQNHTHLVAPERM
ncbi:hypothetical protein D3C71_1490680 [compost metagenome]